MLLNGMMLKGLNELQTSLFLMARRDIYSVDTCTVTKHYDENAKIIVEHTFRI